MFLGEHGDLDDERGSAQTLEAGIDIRIESDFDPA
jgi:hypothetical protein